MRYVFVLLLTACTTGDWADYNYGPGDWLDDNTSLKLITMHNYERFSEPKITLKKVERIELYCGTLWVDGCATVDGQNCSIWVAPRASRSTIEHEIRHCHGWVHYEPPYEHLSSMGPERRERELDRAAHWYPHPRYLASTEQ